MLLLKLLLVPSLIALITLAGRRWGPAVAGWLSGFPVVAGPVLLMIGIEQGPMFASEAAHASLAAVLGNVCFSLGYSWTALRYHWSVCVAAGALAFLAAAFALTTFPLPLSGALAATLTGLWLARYAFPREAVVQPAGIPSRLELPARMCAGAVLSVSVTTLAERIGPSFSGLLAVIPVMALVFGVFSHVTWGCGGAIRLLGGMVRGLYAFAAFCFTAALVIPGFGVGIGFLLALACALVVQAATFKQR